MKKQFTAGDVAFMRRALALAERGRGSTRPNPVVGAVIIRRGRVIAEGYHRRAGQPHAEIRALQALKQVGGARGATLYVNLEPCCHTGRTGPCTTALIDAGFARVVVGCRDPNPRVDGRGLALLRRAGIRVDVGCLEDECLAANRAFAIWVRRRRPLVTLKVAATLDGYIADGKARPRRAPAWITGAAAREAAHGLRAQHDAILVGAGTVAADDPRLTVRLRRTRRGAATPLRVILDGRLRTSPAARVLPQARSGETTVVVGAAGAPQDRVRALERAGAEVVLLPGHRGRVPIARVLAWLATLDVQSLLVEGGADVHGAFVRARLVDGVAFFMAPRLLGGGIPVASGAQLSLGRALPLGPMTVRPVGHDLLITADVAGPARSAAVPPML
ncbi:MAG TPA: bifunctional diaminohydroxyphosphoribosylaminopyrimidine deaminase/5-amino-6-(5-phosphoribosylamino)uracil reductase RibD [Polyangia bacterium]|nr:bifunctional diaminohydroxyphosphoribosylaminopyrimidine deaminase/5-amino-6-(5-phosphoribosylamino)uracil reductase RibD [Polyangia bacterium]